MKYHDPYSKEEWIELMEEAICPNINGRSCPCKDHWEDPCTCPLKLTVALEELYDAGFRDIEELKYQKDCKKKKAPPTTYEKKEESKKRGWHVN